MRRGHRPADNHLGREAVIGAFGHDIDGRVSGRTAEADPPACDVERTPGKVHGAVLKLGISVQANGVEPAGCAHICAPFGIEGRTAHEDSARGAHAVVQFDGRRVPSHNDPVPRRRIDFGHVDLDDRIAAGFRNPRFDTVEPGFARDQDGVLGAEGNHDISGGGRLQVVPVQRLEVPERDPEFSVGPGTGQRQGAFAGQCAALAVAGGQRVDLQPFAREPC